MAKNKPLAGPKEQKEKARQQKSRGGTANSTTTTRSEKTNARGGNKPVSKQAQVDKTKNRMKRITAARKADAKDEAAKKVAKKAALKKTAGKVAARAIPGVGAALLAKDAYDAVKADGKRTSKGGQMSRKKANPSGEKPPGNSQTKTRTDKMKKNKKPSK